METQELKRYSAGFLFAKTGALTRVLLVRKRKPDWQRGHLNAVGGVFEPGEEAAVCMAREFYEEANYITSAWDMFCSEYGPGYEVHFFRAWKRRGEDWTPPSHNDSGEELEWCDPHNLKSPAIGNVHWLLQMALDPRQINSVIRTTSDIRKIVTW
jgi:8-oxo-dGTP pyrophosphatase MutT (NUDIX family)